MLSFDAPELIMCNASSACNRLAPLQEICFGQSLPPIQLLLRRKNDPAIQCSELFVDCRIVAATATVDELRQRICTHFANWRRSKSVNHTHTRADTRTPTQARFYSRPTLGRFPIATRTAGCNGCFSTKRESPLHHFHFFNLVQNERFSFNSAAQQDTLILHNADT